MAQFIDKDAVLAIIKEHVKSLFENNDRIYDEYGNYFYKNAENDYRFYHKLDDFEWDEDKLSLSDVAEYLFPIKPLEVKEVDHWHEQSKEDILYSLNDWDLHTFVCLMNDGSIRTFTGCQDECYDGAVFQHLDCTDEKYEWEFNDIKYWTEIPNISK